MGAIVRSRMRCPFCGATVVPYSNRPPMVCPGCGAKLRMADRGPAFLEVYIAVIAAPALGFRGWNLLIAIPIAYGVALVARAIIEQRFFPPRLEPFDQNAHH